MRKPAAKTSVEVFAEVIPGTEVETVTEIKADYIIGEVDYTKGGLSYTTYKQVARGYRLSVMIRTRGRSKTGGFSSEAFVMFGGINKGEFIEEAKMFSGKRLAALAQDATILERLQNLKAECLAIYRAKHQTGESEAVAV